MWGIEGFFLPLLGFFPSPVESVYTGSVRGSGRTGKASSHLFCPILSLSLSLRPLLKHPFLCPKRKGDRESGAKRKKNFPLPAPRCRLFFHCCPTRFPRKKPILQALAPFGLPSFPDPKSRSLSSLPVLMRWKCCFCSFLLVFPNYRCCSLFVFLFLFAAAYPKRSKMWECRTWD